IAPNLALVDCQRQAEREARRARLGVWQGKPAVNAKQLERGGFALVQGQVARVERNRGGIWLELDGPLVLRVDAGQLGHFDPPGLMALAGRRVEARGWVVDRARGGAMKAG